MPKYVTQKETDVWGNDKMVTRSSPSAYDVGSAVGAGLGILVAANRNAKLKDAINTASATQKYLESGEYDKALISADALIRTTDQEAQTIGHFFKGSAFEGLERADDAVKEYTAALDMARSLGQLGSLAIAIVSRGRCYIQKNDLGAAMRDFTAYIQVEPTEDIGYYWQAIALKKLGDLDQALSNINKAVSINPGDAANYSERAAIYEKRMETSQAIDDLSRAITLNPQNASSYRRRGALYASISDNEKSIADYSRAIELDPNDLESVRGRAAIYHLTGDTVKHAADMSKVSQEGPIQRAYTDYFTASNNAYNSGVRNIYSEAAKNTKPNWPKAVKNIFISIIFVIVLDVCGAIIASSMSVLIGWIAFILLILLPIQIINVARSTATDISNAATAYRSFLSSNEPNLPGLEQFFQQYLQAKKESRLQNLPDTTRPFFQDGAGKQKVEFYSSK